MVSVGGGGGYSWLLHAAETEILRVRESRVKKISRKVDSYDILLSRCRRQTRKSLLTTVLYVMLEK